MSPTHPTPPRAPGPRRRAPCPLRGLTWLVLALFVASAWPLVRTLLAERLGLAP